MKMKNVRQQPKTSQKLLKILSSIDIDKINILCKFQVSTIIRF